MRHQPGTEYGRATIPRADVVHFGLEECTEKISGRTKLFFLLVNSFLHCSSQSFIMS